MTTAHENIKAAFETYLAENETFTGKGTKAAAPRARQALQDLAKACKARRQEISQEKAALPTAKR